MTTSIGVICDKTGFGYTVLESGPDPVQEGRIEVPASKGKRGAELDWLLEEAIRTFDCDAGSMAVLKAGAGLHSASAERHEVEGLLQVAAFRLGLPCQLLTREQVRSLMGVPKGRGAYETLLADPQVRCRSNAVKREQFVFALAAQRLV